MKSREYLLSYTVKSQKSTDSCLEMAESVRKDIAEISELHHLEHLETTRYGFMHTFSGDAKVRQAETEEHVTDLFKEVLKKHRATEANVKIHCAIMLEGSGGEFHFTVSYS